MSFARARLADPVHLGSSLPLDPGKKIHLGPHVEAIAADQYLGSCWTRGIPARASLADALGAEKVHGGLCAMSDCDPTP